MISRRTAGNHPEAALQMLDCWRAADDPKQPLAICLEIEMVHKLSTYQDDVFRYCNEVLHYVWDPIGVAACPQARDEYDSYVPGVVSLLFSDASAKTIAKHLTQITTGSMGLSARHKHDLEVAELLIDWCQVLKDRDPLWV